MAATVRSEAYNGLVRKIGYSVGLEKLAQRVADLTDVYVGRGALDGADWRELVNRWRRPTAEQHIADVYAQFDLIRRQRNTIQVLPALDVLSIIVSGRNPLSPNLGGDDMEAVKFVLLFKILEADGDIFLNALASRFLPVALDRALQTMIRAKRLAVAPLFKQAGSIRRIMEAISIRNQTEGTSRGKRQTYAERSRLLHSPTAAFGRDSADWTNQAIAISEDYLEKVCVTRRAWAEDLDLFRRGSDVLTSRGERLLGAMKDIGLGASAAPDSAFAFWPYGFMLRSIGIAPEEIEAPDLSSSELLRTLATVWHDSDLSLGRQSPTRVDLLNYLRLIKDRYQHVSRRGIIRHDLPLFIAEPVLTFWLMQAGQPLIDIRGFLREEINRPDRMIDFVMIRGTEGGLRLMGESDGDSR